MRRLLILGLLALPLTACDEPSIAYGEPNSIIAVMSPELWDEVADDMFAALEPTIRTVRDERAFTVTFQDPTSAEWGNLRRFRQMVLVGTGEETWMQDALEKVRDGVDGAGQYRSYDVWSRGQQVTSIVLSEAGNADEFRGYLAGLGEEFNEQFRGYARNRMYMTGADTALADTLMTQAGFQLLLPVVYKWSRQDSLYLFRNDNPDPSELIRNIAITWLSPIPEDMEPEGLLEWRTAAAERYGQPQVVDLAEAAAGPLDHRGQQAYQIQAIWKNPPELDWPAAGPFITRGIICPQQQRMYLVDAWLYAPGRDKYEYMIQLETILDSFECGRS